MDIWRLCSFKSIYKRHFMVFIAFLHSCCPSFSPIWGFLPHWGILTP